MRTTNRVIAILLGLAGHTPEGVDPEQVPAIVTAIRDHQTLDLDGERAIAFAPRSDLIFDPAFLPGHPCGTFERISR